MALTVAHTTSTAKANNPAYDISANAWNGTGAHTVAFTSGSLTGTGETVTASTPVLDLSQTWNNGVSGFTGIKLNITNTASLATSAYLIDLQVGGVSKFKVDPTGRLTLSTTGYQDPFGFGSLLEIDGTTSAASLQVNRWDNGSTPPRVVYSKSRGGTIGTAGALLSGDQLFEFASYGYDATPALQESVIIGAAVDGPPTAGSIPGRIIFSTAASGSATPTERLRIDSAGVLSFSSGATATALRVYNTVDSVTSPVNFERGVFDWTTTSNVLTIGTQAGGTGSARNIQFVIGGTNRLDYGVTHASAWTLGSANGFYSPFGTFISASGTGPGFFCRIDTDSTNRLTISLDGSNNPVIAFGPGGASAFDLGFARSAANVLEINNGTVGTLTGCYLHWGGQARVTSDFNTGNSTTLANVTGLSVNVAAGRTYTFEAELYLTDAAAGGAKAAIAGTATATAIQYTGYMIADNAIKAKTNATALATAVASSTTTETAGIIIRITGTITVNAGGTLTVQLAQNTGNATGTIAKQGSYFIVHDMP